VSDPSTGLEITSGVRDTLDAIGRRKASAGKARGPRAVGSLASPREVFIRVADAVGARLTAQGFRYAKSGPHVTRRKGPLKLTVHFASSHYNVAGEYVAFQVGGWIDSTPLRDWRKDRGARATGYLTGSNLNGLMMNHAGWVEWNVATVDPDVAADEIAAPVVKFYVPWFANFESPENLATMLSEGEIRGLDAADAVEYLTSLDLRDAAQSHARWWLAAEKRRRDEFDQALASFGPDNPATLDYSYSSDAAALAAVVAACSLRV
jgi:hypothetical protein